MADASGSGFAAYLQGWSALHGDIDPRSTKLVYGWLACSYAIARPLAVARISPSAVTVFGLFIAVAVPILAWFSQSGSVAWLWVATFLIPVSGMVDSLDGAVAVMSGRTTEAGQLLDAGCDRLSEVAMISALLVVGADVGWGIGFIVGSFLLEYLRARAAVTYQGWQVPLTIAERPTRLIVCGVFLGLSALAPFAYPSASWATWGCVVGTIVVAVGVVQLVVHVRRRGR